MPATANRAVVAHLPNLDSEPPPARGDAYSSPTKVGPMSKAHVDELLRKADLSERVDAVRRASQKQAAAQPFKAPHESQPPPQSMVMAKHPVSTARRSESEDHPSSDPEVTATWLDDADAPPVVQSSAPRAMQVADEAEARPEMPPPAPFVPVSISVPPDMIAPPLSGAPSGGPDLVTVSVAHRSSMQNMLRDMAVAAAFVISGLVPAFYSLVQ